MKHKDSIPTFILGKDGRKYNHERILGEGAFGFVSLVSYDNKTTCAACKYESATAEYPQLKYEAKVLLEIYTHSINLKTHVIPRPIDYIQNIEFKDGLKFNALVMERCGRGMETVLEMAPGKKLPLRIVSAVAYNTLRALHVVHSCGFAHRDIKPDNILFSNKVDTYEELLSWTKLKDFKTFIIDFGLAKKMFDEHNIHVANETMSVFLGTPRYASLNAHNYKTITRRDDIESLLFVLIYLFAGELPWQQKRRGQRIKSIKSRLISDKESGIFPSLPRPFIHMFNHLRELNHADMPDFCYLCKIWRRTYEEESDH